MDRQRNYHKGQAAIRHYAMLSNRDNPDNCYCVGHYCKEEAWECHTSADCAKLDKCKELEGNKSCSCRGSTCESELKCTTKVEESFQFTIYFSLSAGRL